MSDIAKSTRKSIHRNHTRSIWASIAVATVGVAFLVWVTIARVFMCAVNHLDKKFGMNCDFRELAGVIQVCGITLLLIVFIYLAEYDPTGRIDNFVGWRSRFKHPHEIGFAAWRALLKEGTPHRKKTIGVTLVWLVLVVIFFYAMAMSRIAF